MRAMIFEQPGPPEVLQLHELPAPSPGPGQVLIRVAYAGVNYAEVMYRRGDFSVATPFTPGLEVAGHVEALGEGVEDLREGQAVAALTLPGGGYAEYAVAPAVLTYPLDTHFGAVPLEVAAGFPCVAPTAYGLVHVVGRVQPGDTVLVHAAAGGVGGVACQIARHLGARRIIGVVGSEDKVAYARGLGYDTVLTRDEFPAGVAAGAGVDVILDGVGGDVRRSNLELLAPLGRLVVFGNPGAEADVQISTNNLWYQTKSVVGYSIGTLATKRPDLLRAHSLEMLDLVAQGVVRIDVTDVHDLRDAADAHRRLQERATRGKTVLHVGA
jgi:NADPH2:quinone reductase